MTARRPRSSILDIFDPLENTHETILARFDPLHNAPDTDIPMGLGLVIDSDRESSDKENDTPPTPMCARASGKSTPFSRKRRLIDIGDDSIDDGTPPPKRAPLAELLTADEGLASSKSGSAPSTPSRPENAPHVRSPLAHPATPLLIELLSSEDTEEHHHEQPKLVDAPLLFLAPPTLERREMPADLSLDISSASFFLPLPLVSETLELPPDTPADVSSSSFTLGSAAEASFNLLSDKLSFLNISADSLPPPKASADTVAEDAPLSPEEREDMAYELARREVSKMKREGRWLFDKSPERPTSKSLKDANPPQAEPEDKENTSSACSASPAPSTKSAPSPKKGRTAPLSTTAQRLNKRASLAVPALKQGSQSVRRLSTLSHATTSTSTTGAAAASRRLSAIPSASVAPPLKIDSHRRVPANNPSLSTPTPRARPSIAAPRVAAALSKPGATLTRPPASTRTSVSTAPRPSAARPSAARPSLATSSLARRPPVGRPSTAARPTHKA